MPDFLCRHIIVPLRSLLRKVLMDSLCVLESSFTMSREDIMVVQSGLNRIFFAEGKVLQVMTPKA